MWSSVSLCCDADAPLQVVEEVAQRGVAPVVGTADLDKDQLEHLHSWAQVREGGREGERDMCFVAAEQISLYVIPPPAWSGRAVPASPLSHLAGEAICQPSQSGVMLPNASSECSVCVCVCACVRACVCATAQHVPRPRPEVGGAVWPHCVCFTGHRTWWPMPRTWMCDCTATTTREVHTHACTHLLHESV